MSASVARLLPPDLPVAERWPTPPAPPVGSTEAIVAPTAASIDGALRAGAWRASGGDPDLADDFYQQALIRLWNLEPARFDEAERGYLATVLVHRMRDMGRSHRRKRKRQVSLEARVVSSRTIE